MNVDELDILNAMLSAGVLQLFAIGGILAVGVLFFMVRAQAAQGKRQDDYNARLLQFVGGTQQAIDRMATTIDAIRAADVENQRALRDIIDRRDIEDDRLRTIEVDAKDRLATEFQRMTGVVSDISRLQADVATQMQRFSHYLERHEAAIGELVETGGYVRKLADVMTRIADVVEQLHTGAMTIEVVRVHMARLTLLVEQFIEESKAHEDDDGSDGDAGAGGAGSGGSGGAAGSDAGAGSDSDYAGADAAGPPEGTPVPAPPQPETVVAAGYLVISVVTALVGAVALFATGTFAGISGAALYLARLKDDAATITALEKMYDSVPDSVAQRLLDIIELLDTGVDLLHEVTDGEPVVGKLGRIEGAG
ncbi:hypothetical protein HC928_03820 [bacterium]|nr:hypothetical protein [bacterium]